MTHPSLASASEAAGRAHLRLRELVLTCITTLPDGTTVYQIEHATSGKGFTFRFSPAGNRHDIGPMHCSFALAPATPAGGTENQ